ncbi:MAG: hypothetical protein QOK05_2027 [Chloroflexota bacterium]|jgi:NAD(P)-dependent dehydrogenase (short-subunit alcohol dehydrogenase family)|nr:hypothetical protein [Chloroflexota bacterium]
MSQELDGRVAIVTGAGHGLGRCHAIELATQGARVIVNDLDESAEDVASEIRHQGGEAQASRESCATFGGAERLVAQAIERFGDLHILVNNAGILRDRMIFNMSEEDWDAVIDVHGRGHFAPTRFACAFWRQQAKLKGGPVSGRIVHTTSRSGIFGAAGQSNYAFAKGGIIGFSLAVARDMEQYGVTSNAVAPVARTRLTEGTFGEIPLDSGFDRWDPANVSPFVAYLCTDSAAAISGQVFVVFGGEIQLIEQFQHANRINKADRWTVEELGQAVKGLFTDREMALPDRHALPELTGLATDLKAE